MNEDINKLFKKMEHLKKLNDILFKKIQKNLKSIYSNVNELNDCIRDKEIESAQELLESNKILSERNEEYLTQQTAIVDEMDELKTKILIDSPEKTLKITVDGFVPFDDKHPFYRTIFFVEMLRDYYEGEEKYELCAQIQNHLETIKSTNEN